MSFMVAQMTDKEEWVRVEGDCGTDYIPGDVVNLDALRAELSDTANDGLTPSSVAMVRDYTENTRITEIEIVSGYGVRSSAPGYMDCTPWEFYTNKREAISARAQHRRECEGDGDEPIRERGQYA